MAQGFLENGSLGGDHCGNNAPGVDIVIPEIEYNDEKNEILNSKLYGSTPSSESKLLDELSIRTAEILGSFRSVL